MNCEKTISGEHKFELVRIDDGRDYWYWRCAERCIFCHKFNGIIKNINSEEFKEGETRPVNL